MGPPVSKCDSPLAACRPNRAREEVDVGRSEVGALVLWNLPDASLSEKVVAGVLGAAGRGTGKGAATGEALGQRERERISAQRFLGQRHTWVTSSDTEIPLDRAVILSWPRGWGGGRGREEPRELVTVLGWARAAGQVEGKPGWGPETREAVHPGRRVTSCPGLRGVRVSVY